MNVKSATTLVPCFVLSRLDYCNVLLSGLPRESINKLQKFRNCAVRLMLGMRKRDHITHALKTLHWLPVQQIIQYKTFLLCYESKVYHSLTPPCISDLLSTVRTLRSTSDHTRLHTRFQLKQYGESAFSRFAPSLWNTLPPTQITQNYNYKLQLYSWVYWRIFVLFLCFFLLSFANLLLFSHSGRLSDSV